VVDGRPLGVYIGMATTVGSAQFVGRARERALIEEVLREAEAGCGGAVAALLEEPEEDLLAFYGFPADHRAKLRSTNPHERVNREIGRRTDVVGIFPNDRALLRLAASIVIEQNDEWLVGRRYLSLDWLAPLLEELRDQKDQNEVLELTAA
jgi:hypothetical protein